ncbi:hypothetical protein D1609_02910 [Leptospira borgpetersenii serovar Hardjo-bovis]|nr:hypothetical protein D1609_02910 [Leptospira borgpetersenii serovar Hardjo-bovis]TQE51241.1 hypothetical protein FFZ96_17960 [Leptospira borgpetersenii]
MTALTHRKRTRFSFLLCQKDQTARFCPSFRTEPYIEFTLRIDLQSSDSNFLQGASIKSKEQVLKSNF